MDCKVVTSGEWTEIGDGEGERDFWVSSYFCIFFF